MALSPPAPDAQSGRLARWIPAAVVAIAAAGLVAHGPIAQPEAYHAFADRRAWRGVPNAADVLSNLGFAFAGAWAAWVVFRARARDALGAAWPGFALFAVSLVLTAAGSAYYHWAPDNATLVWDRLPIALACAGLLAGWRALTVAPAQPAAVTAALAAMAAASVAWWWFTESQGAGDLRPYLVVQAAPLVLVPIWQALARAPRPERMAYAAAIVLYVAAKLAELADGPLLEATGMASGHTLKHLLAALAAAVLIAAASRRRAGSP